MQFLKAGAAQTPKVSLRRLLHRNLSGKRPGRTSANVHASAVTANPPASYSFCARMYALWDIHQPGIPEEFLSTALAMTFRIGRDVETHVQEAMRDALVGHWRCPQCSRFHEFQKRPERCQHLACSLKGHLLEYEEVRFTSLISGISCGIDILFDEGTGKHRVCESKSMDKDECKKLTAPLAEHRLRMMLYLRIIEESGSPYKDRVHTDEGVILYTSKGGFGFADPEVKTWGFPDQAFSPFKEYRVKRNDDLTEPYHQRGVGVKAWRSALSDGLNPSLPARTCQTSMDSRARACQVCKQCFAGGT